MPKQHRSLTAGAAALVGAKALSFVLTLALPLILARRFDLVALGTYRQVFTVMMTLVTLVQPGFCMNSYYFFPREPKIRPSVAVNCLFFAIFAGLIPCVALLVDPKLLFLGGFVKEHAALAEAPWIALVILLWSGSLFIELAPLANQDLAFATKYFVVANTVRAACLLAGAVWTNSLHGLLVAAVLFYALQLIVLVAYLQSKFPGFLSAFSFPVLKRQLAYTSKVLPANLLGEAQTSLPLYFVMYTYSTATYAIYAQGCMNIPVTQILLESVGSILIGKVNQLEANGDRQEIIRLIMAAARKLAVVFFPFYVLMAIVSREFIVFLFKEKFLGSVPIFVLNLSLVPLYIVMFDPIWRAFPEQQKSVLKIRGAALVILAIGLWIGTSHFGPVAATVAVLITAIFERFMLLFFWGRILGAGVRDLARFRDIGRIAVSAIGAGMVTWIARLGLLGMKPLLILIACGCVFVPVYVALLFVLAVPTSEERSQITSRVPWLSRQPARLA